MKYTCILICIFAIVASCQDRSAEEQQLPNDSATLYNDEHVTDTIDVFSGDRFRNVKAERIGDSTFLVTGEAQVFEAAFSWVIEDGHNEIKQGHGMTDAGAPAWGKFSFEVNAKAKPNTVLHLILFEASAKDGSRQHELPVVLK